MAEGPWRIGEALFYPADQKNSTSFGSRSCSWHGTRSEKSMARRRSSIADDLVLLPWWVSVALAAAAYLILPGMLPKPIVQGGTVGIITMVLLALGAISALRSWKTANMLEQQTGLDSIRELPWKHFEDLLGEAFRRQGYKVEETLGGGADGGVDLVLGRGGEVTLEQCKRWKGKPVPVQIVREMYGVLADRRVTAAKVVAATSFTSEAIAFAKGKPIELVRFCICSGVFRLPGRLLHCTC